MSIISGCHNSSVFVSGDEFGTIYIGKYSCSGGISKYDKFNFELYYEKQASWIVRQENNHNNIHFRLNR